MSPELTAGIAAYNARVTALGGYGTRVRATMPDGAVREGTLGEAGSGGCQPQLTDGAGVRWSILSLDSVEAAE